MIGPGVQCASCAAAAQCVREMMHMKMGYETWTTLEGHNAFGKCKIAFDGRPRSQCGPTGKRDTQFVKYITFLLIRYILNALQAACV